MGGLFGGAAPPPPTPPPAPPSRSDAEIRQAAMEARQRRAAATGRSETIATSGSGVKAEDEVISPVKKLLGE